jgi:hypothetical protein
LRRFPTEHEVGFRGRNENCEHDEVACPPSNESIIKLCRSSINCVQGTAILSYKAKPVPSPVHRYKARTSRLRNCCSPKSSTILPRTCDKADRITFRKFLCSHVRHAPFETVALLT